MEHQAHEIGLPPVPVLPKSCLSWMRAVPVVIPRRAA
jgi:hypothetical protein